MATKPVGADHGVFVLFSVADAMVEKTANLTKVVCISVDSLKEPVVAALRSIMRAYRMA